MAGRKRRENGTGWLSRRKDGRWQSALPGPGGKVSYFYGRTQAEALAKLEEAKRRIAAGGPAIPPRTPYADHLAAWLASKAALSGATRREYEADIRLHVLPDLGAIPVARLTPQHIQSLYNRLSATPSGGGRALAPATIHRLHNGVVYPSLDLAVRWGLAARNVAALVDLPKLPKPSRRALSPAEARRFLAAIAGDPLEALYLLALTTGLRQGELLGLRWADLDLDAGILAVSQQWKRAYAGREMGPPKSEAGRRGVLLVDLVTDALRRHRDSQEARRILAGPAWHDAGLVFPARTGKPLNPAYLRAKLYYPLLARAGLPRLLFHELRHSAATLLLAAGVPMPVVSRILGHANIRITVDAYGHLGVADQAEAARAMRELLGG